MNDVPPIRLARPEDVKDKPKIALHLMVKNGASVVGRLIDCVGPYLSEVVCVLNDCEDTTSEVLTSACRKHSLNLDLVPVTVAKYPSLYLLDVPETYVVGNSLVGETYQGPFTGRPILANWATARNIGWERPSAADWKLFLDADDVVDDPHCLPGLCRMLEDLGIHVAASRYHYDRTKSGQSRADAYRERLARNLPGIRWKGMVHECLAGYAPGRAAHVDGNLVVRDLRDSTGNEIRIPGRNLKVLYYQGRSWVGWCNLTSRELVYLAAESKSVMPGLAARLSEMCVEKSTWQEEKAWACCIRGELYEYEEDFVHASEWYEAAVICHPGVMSAFRLARSRFHERCWREVVEAYEMGIKNKAIPQLLDGGDVYEDATKIFVAVALGNLGRYEEAAAMLREARKKFPGSMALDTLAEKLGKVLT